MDKTNRLLLIKPRWFSPEATAAQMDLLRQEHPGAQITLMAEQRPTEAVTEFIALPDLRRADKRTLLATARRLRKIRYDEAIVIADEARQEVGYLEAKFWAFTARARVRKLGTIRPLRFTEEAYDKWRRIVLQRVFLAAIRVALGLNSRLAGLRRARSEQVVPVAVRRLEAFVTLHQAERLSGNAPGRLLAVGTDDAFADMARQLGWHVTVIPCDDSVTQGIKRRDDSVPNGNLFSSQETLELIYLVGDPACLDSHQWARVNSLLAPGGHCMLRLRTSLFETAFKVAKMPAEAATIGNFIASLSRRAEVSGLEVVQAGESLLGENRIDIWLRARSEKAGRP